MFKNYGDKNFFESGRLVEKVDGSRYDVIYCSPCYDQDEKYVFAYCFVDIDPEWMDQKQIEDFADVKKESDPMGYAVEYYGVENFQVRTLDIFMIESI